MYEPRSLSKDKFCLLKTQGQNVLKSKLFALRETRKTSIISAKAKGRFLVDVHLLGSDVRDSSEVSGNYTDVPLTIETFNDGWDKEKLDYRK